MPNNGAIYCKPHRDDSLRDRLLHRVGNVLCRVGLHDWCAWYNSPLWGGLHRSCRHCTAAETEPLPSKGSER